MTIFVIVALVIVVIGVLFYLFRGDIASTTTSWENNPPKYIYDCVIEDLGQNIKTISEQGGAFEPGHSYTYNGKEIDYLCYTPLYYDLCQVEKPMLVSQVENEILNSIEQKLDECYDSMVMNYEEAGYKTNLKKEDFEVLLYPDEIRILTNTSLTVEKKEVNTHDNFNIILKNDLYELVSIAYNIVNWETTMGDADVNIYMDLDNRFIIDKVRRQDGTKIYIIKEVETGEIFQFASRSLVSPAGIGARVV